MSGPFKYRSNANAAALAVAAAVMLVPANLLPVLATATSGNNRTDTIFSGVMNLWHNGLWGIAAIVFIASIVIPILKLAGLALLLYRTRHATHGDPHMLTGVYTAIDFIGRWSMLDVFLGAFLTGLIQFGEFSTVAARSGIVAFAAAVVLTVLATQAFDPHAIWHGEPSGRPEVPTP
jgi:paraquat-inducible protein A